MIPPSAIGPTIMLVDDAPANLKLLEAILSRQGYHVRSFPRGRLALAAAAESPPDLVLLDIGMPEMDGYEVCTRLKDTPALARIPVIFISGLSETFNKVEAFGCGGVDYVTKPFQVEEIIARVATHLNLHRLQQQVEQHRAELDELVRVRTGQLAEANARLAGLDRAKSDFLRRISHELRTPLNGLFGVAELLQEECPVTPLNQELKHHFRISQRRILTLMNDALLLSEIEVEGDRFPSELIPLLSLLEAGILEACAVASERQISFGPLPSTTRSLRGDRKLLMRALQALLETAVKFARSHTAPQLTLDESAHHTCLRIEAHGHAVPPDALGHFFDVLATGDALTPGGDLGLEPAVGQRILALFGGETTVENLEPPGIALTLRFIAM